MNFSTSASKDDHADSIVYGVLNADVLDVLDVIDEEEKDEKDEEEEESWAERTCRISGTFMLSASCRGICAMPCAGE